MKTIIMAGGRGTRIAELFPNIPKPLIPVDGMPILEREIRSLARQGFDDIILTVGYLADKIISYFGDGSRFGVKIEYFVEKTPLGNAGALFRLRDKIGDEPFLLLNADAAFDVDFNRMIAYHKEHGGLVTLFTHPNSHPYDSGLIIADKDGKVERWLSKEDERPQWYDNRVNAGLHVIDPKVLDLSAKKIEFRTKNLELSEEERRNQNLELRNQNLEFSNGAHGLSSTDQVLSSKIDLDRQLLKPLCGTGEMYCYDSPEYVKDMGTPERFRQVEADFKAGIVEAKNLNHKQKAIFLDRDGTINKYVGFLSDINDFELIEGVAEAIKKINESGYLAIVVTNQPVIARGEVSWDELYEIHRKMQTLLGKQGAYLDGIYVCPHHPDKGFEGERPEYKIDCDCRKPKPGLLLRAAKDFNIDLSLSFMIGDSERDVEAGHNAHTRNSILIKTNQADSLMSAIKGIKIV